MTKAGALAALLIVPALFLVGAQDAAIASSFVPTYTVTLSNSTASANSNFTVDYEIDSPAVMEGSHVSFIPPDFGVADDASITDGARVGSIALTATESVNNGSCSSFLSFGYDLFDATTDTGNVLSDTPPIPSAAWPGFLDGDVNNLEDAIDKYPAFLNTLFPGLTPRSRSFGWVPDTFPPATINRAVNVLIFEPGATLPGLGIMDASLGYPVVVVAQDPTAPAASSAITDQCTIFNYTRQDRGVTLNNPSTGVGGGAAYRTNPSADGTYTFVEYAQSRRDHDGDGIENHLDTCPFDSTPAWEPRISDPVNDPDGDGIPGQDDGGQVGEQLLAGSGCDTTPLTANDDDDADGFKNREDNCALTANATQDDTDGDGIGDSCDVVVTAADGHLHEICVTDTVDIGLGGSPTTPTCPQFVLDQDNDGFTDADETYLGTGPTDPCGQTGWPADLLSSGMSLNDVDIQDITSFLVPVRYIGTDVGTNPGDVRWDLMPGAGVFSDDINLQDLVMLILTAPPMLEGPRAFSGPPCPYAP